ncbi:MAG: hypothetical protein JO027_10510 [Solirubrobacterales bacterium]|nr:hypothetical protein [Solirubrobacterales bacterium]
MRVRWPFLLALALALVALALRYTVLTDDGAGAISRPDITLLEGVTGQGTKFELGIKDHRVYRLRTALNARCRGGSSVYETWSPAEHAPVHFTIVGRTFTTVERGSPSYPDGVVGRVAFTIRGTFTASGAAQGTIRLVGRYYHGEREWNACDSLDVAWAVGPQARARLRTVALGTQISEYYPAVPSLAIDPSPARQRFIAEVDETCVDTGDRMWQIQNQVAARYRYSGDATLIDSAVYFELHAWQLRSIMKLGPAPQARALYDAWLANFRQRVLVERKVLILYAHHHGAASRRALASYRPLKTEGNLLGQEFGLTRCTSNGERTLVPELSDGQPLPLP